jgi:hypothetical protein
MKNERGIAIRITTGFTLTQDPFMCSNAVIELKKQEPRSLFANIHPVELHKFPNSTGYKYYFEKNEKQTRDSGKTNRVVG